MNKSPIRPAATPCGTKGPGSSTGGGRLPSPSSPGARLPRPTSEARGQKCSAARKDRGFSLVELLIVVSILAIVIGIVLPHFLSTRSNAQAAAAKGDLKTIHSAQIAYLAGAGRGRYGTFPQLEAQNLLPPGFSSGEDYTYTRFDYTGTLTLGPSGQTFSITSLPPLINSNTPSFFLDDSGSIRSSNTSTANSTSTPVGQQSVIPPH